MNEVNEFQIARIFYYFKTKGHYFEFVFNCLIFFYIYFVNSGISLERTNTKTKKKKQRQFIPVQDDDSLPRIITFL